MANTSMKRRPTGMGNSPVDNSRRVDISTRKGDKSAKQARVLGRERKGLKADPQRGGRDDDSI